MEVLVLDTTGAPVNVVSWQDAVCSVISQRAYVLDEDTEKVLHSANLSMPLPLVIQVKNYIALKTRAKVPFSRRNIILRDDSRCQYCGRLLSSNGNNENSYTMDHVVPRSKGGLSTWTNLVLACFKCNTNKGNKTLAEAGMRLLRAPKEPSSLDPKFNFRLKLKHVRPEWRQHLDWTERESYQYWNAELTK